MIVVCTCAVVAGFLMMLAAIAAARQGWWRRSVHDAVFYGGLAAAVAAMLTVVWARGNAFERVLFTAGYGAFIVVVAAAVVADWRDSRSRGGKG